MERSEFLKKLGLAGLFGAVAKPEIVEATIDETPPEEEPEVHTMGRYVSAASTAYVFEPQYTLTIASTQTIR